jgi:hypothetical protein
MVPTERKTAPEKTNEKALAERLKREARSSNPALPKKKSHNRNPRGSRRPKDRSELGSGSESEAGETGKRPCPPHPSLRSGFGDWTVPTLGRSLSD